MADETNEPMATTPTQLVLPTLSLPSPGTTITSPMTGNTYVIQDRIGDGHFGIVYECTDTWDNQLAAKVLKPEHGDFETLSSVANSEFQKLMYLRHPNITYVHDAFHFNNICYIITERCSSSLSGLLNIERYDGRFWIQPIARCVLQALHFIHINKMVHQDIHLGNVLYSFVRDEMSDSNDKSITFKVGDLGLAKLIEHIDPATSILANWMFPPEFIDGNEFGPMDHRVDIYHCGLLFLQILQGSELRLTRDDVINGIPRQMALELVPPYSFALEKALRRHVLYRTGSAMELWRDLRSPVGG